MLLFILIWGWLVSKRELKGNNDKKKKETEMTCSLKKTECVEVVSALIFSPAFIS